MRLFLHRLAIRLGRTVGELERSMTTRELTDWMAYYQLEPWCDDRRDMQIAVVAATIANANRGKNQRSYRPEDFLVVRPADRQDRPRGAGMIAAAKMWVAMMGGTIIDKTADPAAGASRPANRRAASKPHPADDG